MQSFTYNSRTSVRLDTFIQSNFPQLNTGKLNKYLRENKIKVNGKKIALNSQLATGDVINLYIIDSILYPEADNSPKYLKAKNELDINYEDDNIIIVNKPAGIMVNDEEHKVVDTLENRVILYETTKAEHPSDFLPAPCHRLDTGTSGLVIFAKNIASLDYFLKLIKEHKLTKEYLCVCIGKPKQNKGMIHNYLLKDAKSGVVQIASSKAPGAKEAITYYEVLNSHSIFSLVKLEIPTGRTHQIRVHMACINCPILGDSKYGNNDINRKYKVKRQLLCAYKITLPSLDDKYAYLSCKTFEIMNVSLLGQYSLLN